jgi:small ligand-binding sensory domain FIST
VTEANGNVVSKLGERPAFEAFAEQARPLLHDLQLAAQTVLVAVPATPIPDDPVEEGYVARGILQFDPDRGLLALSQPLPVGTRIRFALRDVYAARDHLRRVVHDLRAALGDRRPRLGLYINCAGRGRGFFGVADHDIAFIQCTLGEFPLVGFFSGGEIAPLRGRPCLNLFSGVLALLT